MHIYTVQAMHVFAMRRVANARYRIHWLTCQFDLIFPLETESEIKSALDNLPASLFESYDRIFLALAKGSKDSGWRTARLVKEVLDLISIDREDSEFMQLSASAVVSLLSVQLTDDETFQLQPDQCLDAANSFLDAKALRRACGCLIKRISPARNDFIAPLESLDTDSDRNSFQTDHEGIVPAHYTITVSESIYVLFLSSYIYRALGVSPGKFKDYTFRSRIESGWPWAYAYGLVHDYYLLLTRLYGLAKI